MLAFGVTVAFDYCWRLGNRYASLTFSCNEMDQGPNQLIFSGWGLLLLVVVPQN